MNVVHIFRRLLKILLAIAFPNACAGCGAADTVICTRCARTLPRASAPQHCAEATIALFRYAHPAVRQLIWQLKYRGNRAVAAFFARGLHDVLVEELAERALFTHMAMPLLIPIPLGRKRRRMRGFNQSELVARELAAIAPHLLEYRPDILKKIRETPAQTTLGRTERLRNLSNAFAIAEEHNLRGRTIILIDDVITTGSTIAHASKALRAAGASDIFCCALAH